MNPIEKIRDQFRKDLLLKLAAKQHKSRIIHLFNMRTMGIITLPPTEEERITLSQFISQMSRNGITVRKIETPPDSEIDKYGIPKPDYANQFTNYHYDLIINATPLDNPFGLYFTLAASSNLRIAYQDTTQPTEERTLNTYDLIILGNGPMVLSEYLTNMLNVLMEIRKTPTGNY